MQARPDRLVFIDETSVKTNMTRTRGRAPKGQRLNAAAPFGRWSTQTFIAGLTADALIAPWIIQGAMNGRRHCHSDQWRSNGSTFATYVETQLAPAIAPGTVVILDNLSTHRNARAAHALRARGCWFPYLPPYSPDPCVAENSLPDCFLYAPHPSKWPSPNSSNSCAASAQEPSTNSSRPWAISATSSHPKNARTTSGTQGMSQHKCRML